MSNRSRPRTIFIEHDNFEDMSFGKGDHYLAAYDYDRASWIVGYDVASDLTSNWQHDRGDRAVVETRSIFALAAVTPAGGAESATWAPINGVGTAAEYALNGFPFQLSINVTTPAPMLVAPTPLPTDAAFAEFGKRAAAILAGSYEWNSDTTSDLGAAATSFLGVDVGNDMNEETWTMWKPLVEEAGMEMWNFEEED